MCRVQVQVPSEMLFLPLPITELLAPVHKKSDDNVPDRAAVGDIGCLTAVAACSGRNSWIVLAAGEPR